MKTKILVVGATGYLGGIIARRLLQRRDAVRIAVRPNSDFSQLVEAGAEPVPADLKEAHSLAAACTGVEVVITTANSARRGGEDTTETVDLVGNRNLIEAAREAGVRQFIFVSAYQADVSHPVPFLQAKARTEETLRAGAMNYTILAPHIFMDVWIPIIVGSALQQNRPVWLVGSGERRHSFIAVSDVAEFALAAIGNQTARNRRIPLGGPVAISWRDIIALVEERSDQPIPVNSMPMGQVPPELSELITGLLTGLEMGEVIIPRFSTCRNGNATWRVQCSKPKSH